MERTYQKNEEQNFVGISFVNGRVSGREKRSGERGRKFLEKKMKCRENLPLRVKELFWAISQ